MNEEKMRHDIGRAIEMAQSIHDDVVKNFVEAGLDSAIEAQAMETVSALATLVWYLKHISEEEMS